jgi:hypothetical protein
MMQGYTRQVDGKQHQIHQTHQAHLKPWQTEGLQIIDLSRPGLEC